jgi:TolB-like protein/Flp pilus assembly protein TadD
MAEPSLSVFRFGEYELDLRAYELRRVGSPVKLGRQPMELLIFLIQRHRQLVSRREIVDRLWGTDVFVDTETGVNTAVSRIRQVLQDPATMPQFLETVPGKGYRFIAAVDAVGDPPRTAATLAVLPFENLTSDSEREYLAAGLTDETSASLAQIDPVRLRVKGRTHRYRGTTKSVAEIGQELGVDYLVASSLRADSIRLRVAVTLIRVVDEQHVWSHIYDREATDLLGLQQELSAAIANQIHLHLSTERMDEVERRQTRNPAAYDAYLRGRFQAHRRTADGNARAIELYKQAIEMDRTYALAWSDLAFTYASACINGDAAPAKAGASARAAANQAVASNPNLSEAQLALAYCLWMIEWQWKAAEGALRTAIELDPSNAPAHRILGHVLSQSGQHDKAEASMQRSCELDRLDPLTHALSSQIAFQAGDLDTAAERARRAIALAPEFWIGHMLLGQAYGGGGEHELALEALSDAVRFSAGNSKPVSLRGYVLAKLQRTEAAHDVMQTLAVASRDRYVPPYAMALVAAGLDDRNATFDFLDKAYDARDVHLMYLPVDMKWDPFRSDSRFSNLLDRCGFAS